MSLKKFEVGKPFPVAVPTKEGACMELWGNGLIVIIQMPDLRRAEVQSFKKGFKKYGYFHPPG